MNRVALLMLSCLTVPTPIFGQACDSLRTHFPKASFGNLKIKYDEVRDLRTITSKGPGLADAVTWELVLYGEARGQQGSPESFVLRYARTQVVMNARDVVRPIARDSTRLYVLADSSRYALVPSSYQTQNDPSLGGLPGYFKEVLMYPIAAEQLAALAEAHRIRVKADDEDVRFNFEKVTKGARAVLLGMSCGWPSSP